MLCQYCQKRCKSDKTPAKYEVIYKPIQYSTGKVINRQIKVYLCTEHTANIYWDDKEIISERKL